jgi:glycosyltransferase involved in cell wall biosynthesis
MRILIVSNTYPPYFVGGYELGCRDIVDGLTTRGHDVVVLTSDFGLDRPARDGSVYRWLTSTATWKAGRGPGKLLKLVKKELHEQSRFRDLCRHYRPDIVYVWNMGGISITIPFLAQRLHIPTAYFVSDMWLATWEDDRWWALWHRDVERLAGRLCGRVARRTLTALGLLPGHEALDLTSVQFASEFLKGSALAAGKQVAEARVIHWGVDVNQYASERKRTGSDGPARLLYVGRMTASKGVHTAIQALALALHSNPSRSATLTLVGGPTSSEYYETLRKMVSEARLSNEVRFTGLVPREALPALYEQHDVLVFPSAYDEPFSIALLEGMAAGLAVVGTPTGGTPEVLRDEVNGLVFPREDASACADQILRLLDDPGLSDRLGQAARRTVDAEFHIDQMISKVEYALDAAVSSRSGMAETYRWAGSEPLAVAGRRGHGGTSALG